VLRQIHVGFVQKQVTLLLLLLLVVLPSISSSSIDCNFTKTLECYRHVEAFVT